MPRDAGTRTGPMTVTFTRFKSARYVHLDCVCGWSDTIKNGESTLLGMVLAMHTSKCTSRTVIPATNDPRASTR